MTDLTRCAYCGIRRAVNIDHVVPKSIRRHRANVTGIRAIPEQLLGTVPACFECNIRKGTRRLVPPSWATRITALNDFFGGTPWRVWMGDVKEPAFSEVHT